MQMSNGTCYESQTELYIEYYLIEMVVWDVVVVVVVLMPVERHKFSKVK